MMVDTLNIGIAQDAVMVTCIISGSGPIDKQVVDGGFIWVCRGTALPLSPVALVLPGETLFDRVQDPGFIPPSSDVLLIHK